MNLRIYLRSIWHFIERENLHRVLLFVLVFVLFSAIGITLFEPGMTFLNGLWWSIVTMTTVGYGDISPVTQGGRVIAVVIMFFGIGLLGTLSATLAGVMVERKIKADQGMNVYNFTNHIILCEWNYRTRLLLKELRTEPGIAETPVVLIAELDRKPVDDDNLYFVAGAVNDESLRRANLSEADTVVIVGDHKLEPTARDAKSVMTTLTVESINPNAYTIVELVDQANVQHCRRANADEIIVSNEISSALMARATLQHGVTRVVSELLTSKHGNELYRLPVPSRLVGRRFMDIFAEMKQKHNCIVLAIQSEEGGEFISNPPADYELEADDYLVVISPDTPRLD